MEFWISGSGLKACTDSQKARRPSTQDLSTAELEEVLGGSALETNESAILLENCKVIRMPTMTVTESIQLHLCLLDMLVLMAC